MFIARYAHLFLFLFLDDGPDQATLAALIGHPDWRVRAALAAGLGADARASPRPSTLAEAAHNSSTSSIAASTGAHMRIIAINDKVIGQVEQLMGMGEPYVRARSSSDYWLYATLFSSTCPVAVDGDQIIGAVVAMRSQDQPGDVYVQDVMTHPEHRRKGIAQALLDSVIAQASGWRCHRLYLTSEANNVAAAATWRRLGFENVRGDIEVNGVYVISDFKGPGKDRAVYELKLC